MSVAMIVIFSPGFDFLSTSRGWLARGSTGWPI